MTFLAAARSVLSPLTWLPIDHGLKRFEYCAVVSEASGTVDGVVSTRTPYTVTADCGTTLAANPRHDELLDVVGFVEGARKEFGRR